MPRIQLDISDPITRLTLKTMLEAAGHAIVTEEAELGIADSFGGAVAISLDRPSLIVATAATLPEAISAMKQGVHGYILLPLQPGEAPLMVERALAAPHRTRPAKPFEPEPLAEVEARHIEETLRFCKGNQAKAARILGIGRNTLWRKTRTRGTEASPAHDLEL